MNAYGFFDNASAKSFTDNGNETVTDNDTGLIWQKGEGGIKTWEAALTYCEALSLGGNSDWRLPDKRELTSLVDFSIYVPVASYAYFPNILNANYLSSTTYAFNTSYAWYVNFNDGNINSYLKVASYNIRCVRAGL